MGKKRKSRKQQTLDDLLRDGIYQRTNGPHKRGPVSQLESWERHAIATLDRFAEQEIPDEDSSCFPVCGRWKFFSPAKQRDDELLHNLAIAFWAFNDAFRLFDEIQQAPSYDLAEKLAEAVMLAMHFALDVGVVTSETWQQGEKYRHDRKLGGKATRKLSPDQQKLARSLIAEQQAAGVNKTPACTRAAAKLKNEHDIEVSAKTLARL